MSHLKKLVYAAVVAAALLAVGVAAATAPLLALVVSEDSVVAIAAMVLLGGAMFPTATKLDPGSRIHTLLLNGVECEPYISCDDMLMREHAQEVLGGAQILLHALELDTCYVVVESDKPEAIHRLGEVLADLEDERLILKQVPTIYPSGGEDQLVQLVANREVPSGGLPTAASRSQRSTR